MIEQLANDLIGFLLPLEQGLQEWAEKQTDAVTADVMRHYAFSARKLAEDVAKAAVDTVDDRK